MVCAGLDIVLYTREQNTHSVVVTTKVPIAGEERPNKSAQAKKGKKREQDVLTEDKVERTSSKDEVVSMLSVAHVDLSAVLAATGKDDVSVFEMEKKVFFSFFFGVFSFQFWKNAGFIV